jgi:hypothetical protein
LSVNQTAKEIGFDDTLQTLVLEALFSFATAKVGLHTVGHSHGHKYGKAFVDVVTIDNLVIDMAAKHINNIQFIGNDYWMDFDDVMESDIFNSRAKNGLHPDEFEIVNEQGEERAETISMSETAADEYRKRIWLRDVYLQKENVVVSYAVKSKRLLGDTEWPTREIKPYYHLGYGKVPGNMLPLSPVSLWRDIHVLCNALYRKMARAADSQKEVMGFSGGNDESAQDFQKATDGHAIKYTGPKPEKLSAGGVNGNTLAFFMNAKELFSYFGGNIDSLGGLAPMTQTVGQDRMLAEAASSQVREMAGQTIGFVREIFRALAWLEWTDPVGQRTFEKELVPGLNVEASFGPADKGGDFSVFDLDINPYSAQEDTPSIKLQKIGLVMQQYILPLMPLIEAQGGKLDVQDLLKTVTKYADLPELQSILQWTTEQGTGKLSAPTSPKDANEHTRQRMRGMTDRGKSAVLQRVLSGDKPQASEMS